jgi:hypothetical protein
MVIEAVRELPVLLRDTKKVTVPSPAPPPGERLIHEAISEAVQLQAAGAPTVMLPPPPLAGSCMPEGEIE